LQNGGAGDRKELFPSFPPAIVLTAMKEGETDAKLLTR